MAAEGNGRAARVALPVLGIAVLCGLIIAGVHEMAAERISMNRERLTLATVMDVMPLSHDNDLLADRLEVSDAAAFGSADPVSIFRARLKGQPAGLVFTPVPAWGYNGRIDLAIGLSLAGELTGVRVTRHGETPGLGDQVHQSHSDWIRQFDGRSLENTPDEAWAVRADGGGFDQISGATITPRGLIQAVRGTLEYYRRNRDFLYR